MVVLAAQNAFGFAFQMRCPSAERIPVGDVILAAEKGRCWGYRDKSRSGPLRGAGRQF